MRIVAGFLCFFLVVLAGGTVSYIYLMWTNYWLRVKSSELKYLPKEIHPSRKDEALRNILHRAHRSDDSQEVNDGKEMRQRPPHFRNSEQKSEDSPKKDIVNLSSLPQDKLLAHLKVYKDQIYSQLSNTVMETGKQVANENFPNAYNVSFRGKFMDQTDQERSPQTLLCDAKRKIGIKTFVRGNKLFKKMMLDRFFPRKELLVNRRFNSCAVVSSAGSLKDSGLGHFIDSHNIVLRFNNAPTDGHVKDVGKKTSIRIVNSQVVAKPQFKFMESPMFSKSAAVLVWDPSGYNASLEQWYNKPDWPFFEQYFSKRLMQPEDALYLLHPESLWSIWNWLQSVTSWPLLPTPPSSGFLGIMLLLNHCNTVHVFEYIPSMRLTKRCHYYETEENLGCTLGDWHPLSAEKLIALSLNTGTDVEMLRDGYITIPGYSSC